MDAVRFELTKPLSNWVTASRDTPTSPYIHILYHFKTHCTKCTSVASHRLAPWKGIGDMFWNGYFKINSRCFHNSRFFGSCSSAAELILKWPFGNTRYDRQNRTDLLPVLPQGMLYQTKLCRKCVYKLHLPFQNTLTKTLTESSAKRLLIKCVLKWWEVKGSNLWPKPCKGPALPLS